MSVNLKNMQGDLFSRGFPKFNETYYFFSITSDKEKEKKFTQALVELGKKEISTLEKVLVDWDTIDKAKDADAAAKAKDPNAKDTIVDVSNALIAFSQAGLRKIQDLLGGTGLGLDKIAVSDPAFTGGMANDRGALNDPASSQWDDLFKSTAAPPIHGVFKVAGNSPAMVDAKLNAIKNILGVTIVDVAAKSLPTTQNSRADGQVRPDNFKGHEHFGFEDGVSQPLLKDIDKKEAFDNDKFMQTPQNVITLTAPITKNRPDWMVDGSFLVFRKLEQDVSAFIDLTQKHGSVGCTSPDQLGAKLMGRWKSGAPIILNPTKDVADKKEALKTNNFKFTNNNVCPLAAHIRKTNPRDSSSITRNARIVRNGIPYGTEFDPAHPRDGKRGLLFACYQSSIESGYQFIQKKWVNEPNFPATGSGFDAFTAQPLNEGPLNVTFFDASATPQPISGGLGNFPKLVTMKGGEYFFVPSISALTSKLGSV